MLRVLLFIALAALPLYAFIDCAMKDDTQLHISSPAVSAEMAADLKRVLSDVFCRLMMTQISYVSSNSL
jgi:hypothetical protein